MFHPCATNLLATAFPRAPPLPSTKALLAAHAVVVERHRPAAAPTEEVNNRRAANMVVEEKSCCVSVDGQQKIQFDKVQKHHQNHTHARLTIAAMASSWRGLVKHIYKQSQAIGVASGPHTVLWSHTAPRLLWQRQQHDTQRRWTHSHTQHSNTMRSPLLIRSASTQTGSANARLIQLCRDGDMKQVKALCSPHTVKTLTNSLKPGMERVLPPG